MLVMVASTPVRATSALLMRAYAADSIARERDQQDGEDTCAKHNDGRRTLTHSPVVWGVLDVGCSDVVVGVEDLLETNCLAIVAGPPILSQAVICVVVVLVMMMES